MPGTGSPGASGTKWKLGRTPPDARASTGAWAANAVLIVALLTVPPISIFVARLDTGLEAPSPTMETRPLITLKVVPARRFVGLSRISVPVLVPVLLFCKVMPVSVAAKPGPV